MVIGYHGDMCIYRKAKVLVNQVIEEAGGVTSVVVRGDREGGYSLYSEVRMRWVYTSLRNGL